MSPRPAVSVVMPFAGNSDERGAAIASLRALRTQDGDELILADNSGRRARPHTPGRPPPPGRRRAPSRRQVVRAGAERSPAHARNVGAAARAAPTGSCSSTPTAARPRRCSTRTSRAGRRRRRRARRRGRRRARTPRRSPHATARPGASSASRRTSRMPYRPRAVAANLMVRRAAFEQIGGFYEGVRAAEDTDFSWRLQQAGWRLELRTRRARRASLPHDGPRAAAPVARVRRRPRVARAPLRRIRARAGAVARDRTARGAPTAPPAAGSDRVRAAGASRSSATGRAERARHLALDALLGVEELRGLALSNRPPRARRPGARPGRARRRSLPGRGRSARRLRPHARHARVEAVGAARRGRRRASRASSRSTTARTTASRRGCSRCSSCRPPSAARCMRDRRGRGDGAAAAVGARAGGAAARARAARARPPARRRRRPSASRAGWRR